MLLDIPEGTHVHIYIGAVTSPTQSSAAMQLPGAVLLQGSPAAKSSRPVVMAALAALVVVAGYGVLHGRIWGGDSVPRALATAIPGPVSAPAMFDPEATPVPNLLPASPAPAIVAPANQMPAAFRQQLERPPQVTPAPGSVAAPIAPPGASTSPLSAFGLHE